MPTLNIDNAEIGSTQFSVPPTQIEPRTTIPQSGKQERAWYNERWEEDYGYYLKIPDLKRAADMKKTWINGGGYTASQPVINLLKNIRGIGRESFNEILSNLIVMASITGDGYAQIIRNDGGKLINLKVLNGSKVGIKYNKQGMIIGYEYKHTNEDGKEVKKSIEIENMFHLMNERRADEIHGTSDIESLRDVITARLEHFENMRTAARIASTGLLIFKHKTQKQSKIRNFKGIIERAFRKRTHIHLPDDEDSLTWDHITMQIAEGMASWDDSLRNTFWRAFGLPQIVPGASGQSTESEAKSILTAFEAVWREWQKKVEDAIKLQLGLEIQFKPSPSLLEQMNQDQAKDGTAAFQPADTQAGVGR